MAVFRVVKNDDYSVMSNLHFKEREMSLKAKGLLSLMLSLPDEWDYSVSGISKLCKESETAIKSTLAELREFGYLVIEKLYPHETESGRIEYVYNIYEKPQKQEGEKQGVENQPLEIQAVEIQEVENNPQLNTNILNTKELNTKEINKEKEKINKKEKEKDVTEEFAELWEIYPRKVGKAKALRMYRKAREKGVAYETIRRGIEAYAAEVQGTAIQYIKHGATWFYNECWNDEYADKPPNEYEGLPGVTVL